MKYLFLLLLLSCLLCSCRNGEKPLNKFHDPALVTIADLQDRRSGDSLLHFLSNPNPIYRRAAAIAFASLQDSTYVEQLKSILLTDIDSGVRKAAAYALGQTPGLKSGTVLIEAASLEKSNTALGEIIQAYGKVARTWTLNVAPVDTMISNALAWACYRMAVRGLSDTTLNRRAAHLLQAGETTARLAAAHYFARGAKDFQRYADVLINAASNDKSAQIRMAAVQALGKIISDTSFKTAVTAAEKDPDYRVRINAIRALQNFPFIQTRNTFITALTDANVNVGIAASEAINGSMTKEYWQEFATVARASKNWRIQANLYAAALSATNHKELAEEIIAAYDRSTNSYQRAALLMVLQHSPMSYGFLREQLLRGARPVIKSSAATALVAMNQHENFDSSLANDFAKIYEEAISDGDMAVIGIVCNALADSALNYKSVIKDFSFLKEARNRLSLPKDYESVVPLQMAIDYFEGNNTTSTLTNDFNHPINWNVVKKIPAGQRAIIKTSKGNITIQLLVEEAPGSVANFVLLAADKYYDGRYIHRVVPNFVVQDGCPRGDGWGGEAYSIRSEFMPHPYRAGSVGMASAGKDTEGTQWFITHSPTPHLEGRYTLFAEVVSGLDVVHALEVGDTVVSVEIINFSPV